MSKETTPERVGRLIKGEAERDAIHVAVAPVVALEKLNPGQHVGVTTGREAKARGPFVGIVDPYLMKPVNPGDSFYLFLYPGTITSLRHDWTHPLFLDDELRKLRKGVALAEAEDWLSNCANDAGISLSKFIEMLEGHIEDGEYITFGFDTPDQLYSTKTLWKHYTTYTGKEVPGHIDKANTFFTCAC